MTDRGTDVIRRVRGFALAGLFWMLLPAGSASAQLEVDQLEMTLRAGDAAAGSTFSVRNTGAVAHTVLLELKDWDRDENGSNRFVDAGTVDGACTAAMTVFPSTIQLDPGETQTVQVTYDGGPRDRSCWSAVSVTTAPTPSTGSGGVRLIVTLQHMVKVYIDPPLTRPGLDLLALDMAPVSGTPADSAQHEVVGLVRNSGNVQVRVSGRVEYRTLADSVVVRREIAGLPVLPSASWRFRSPLPQLPPGRYVVLVLLDYGGADIVAGQLELEIQ